MIEQYKWKSLSPLLVSNALEHETFFIQLYDVYTDLFRVDVWIATAGFYYLICKPA